MLAPCLSLNTFPTERAILAYSVGMAKNYLLHYKLCRLDESSSMKTGRPPKRAPEKGEATRRATGGTRRFAPRIADSLVTVQVTIETMTEWHVNPGLASKPQAHHARRCLVNFAL